MYNCNILNYQWLTINMLKLNIIKNKQNNIYSFLYSYLILFIYFFFYFYKRLSYFSLNEKQCMIYAYNKDSNSKKG